MDRRGSWASKTNDTSTGYIIQYANDDIRIKK